MGLPFTCALRYPGKYCCPLAHLAQRRFPPTFSTASSPCGQVSIDFWLVRGSGSVRAMASKLSASIITLAFKIPRRRPFDPFSAWTPDLSFILDDLHTHTTFSIFDDQATSFFLTAFVLMHYIEAITILDPPTCLSTRLRLYKGSPLISLD